MTLTSDRQTWSDQVHQRIVDLDTLRRFVVDHHPDLPIPTPTSGGVGYMIGVWNGDIPAEMARIADILRDGAAPGTVYESGNDRFTWVARSFGSARLEVVAERDALPEAFSWTAPGTAVAR